MVSKSVTLVTIIASLAIVSIAAPAEIIAISRQAELQASQGGLVTAGSSFNTGSTTTSLEETAPTPTPVVATETSDMSSSETSLAPPAPPAPVAEPEQPGASFAYNIGGEAVGEYQADPEEYITGETSVFVIPDAAIVNAGDEPEDIYRSHRFAMLGTPFSVKFPISEPGFYNCSLHFAETYSEFFTEEPNRTFKVEISGDAADDVQEAEFDVMVELKGQEFTPYVRVFQNIACSTSLTIREIPIIGDAFLAAVKCKRTSALIGV